MCFIEVRFDPLCELPCNFLGVRGVNLLLEAHGSLELLPRSPLPPLGDGQSDGAGVEGRQRVNEPPPQEVPSFALRDGFTLSPIISQGFQ